MVSLPEQFRAEDGSLDGSRCVFVVGAPRSGTSWLQRMIEAHPKVVSIPHELTVFSRYVAPLVIGYDREAAAMEKGRWQQGLPLFWDRGTFNGLIRIAISRVYSEVIKQRPHAGVLLDKHPAYVHHLGLIDRFLPGARIIHLVRDGREVAVSMLSAHARLGFGADNIQGCAQEWCRSVRDARESAALFGDDRFLEVKYENLLAETHRELERIYLFCGLEASPKDLISVVRRLDIDHAPVSRADPTMADLRRKEGASWMTMLSVEQRYLFNQIAGGLLLDLGYAQRGWWALKWTDRLAAIVFEMRYRFTDSVRSLIRAWTKPITGVRQSFLAGSAKLRRS